jgi:AGZA family xanthine/uracil permease-like MFS transporter
MGGGAILGGLVLAAIAVFVIDRKFVKAGAFALAGAILTFFGFMHGEQIHFGESPVMAAAYLAVALTFFGCARYATVAAPAREHAEEGAPAAHGALTGAAG